MNPMIALRRKLGLTQKEFAERLGLARQSLYSYESGKSLPSEVTLAKIAAHHGSPLPMANHSSILTLSNFLRLDKRRPFEAKRYPIDCWARAERRWLSPSLHNTLPLWFKEQVRCDTRDEALAWHKLAIAGAKPFLSNPHELGFRHQPIIDQMGWALGERLLPCLIWTFGSLIIVIWPQVCLRTPNYQFRVDALILTCSFKCNRWSVLEIDGRGHRVHEDEFRIREIGLPPVRFSNQEVQNADFAAQLLRQLKDGLQPKDLTQSSGVV